LPQRWPTKQPTITVTIIAKKMGNKSVAWINISQERYSRIALAVAVNGTIRSNFIPPRKKPILSDTEQT
jgi:hypothetical protein